MPSTEYPFVIATDFPNGKVNIPRLLEDIRQSPIKTAVDYITASGAACSVWFKAELDSTDEGILYGGVSPASDESIIGSHSGAVLLEAGVTKIVNDDQSTVWNQPQTTNKTPIFNPDVIPPSYLLYLTGAFDDLGGGLIGAGDQIEIEATYDGGPKTETLDGQYLTHQYIVGGEIGVIGTIGKGDWASMMAYAPASAPEDRTGTHDGNANKVATGMGFNIIVPAPGNDGDWNVDGSALTAGEINTGLVPVPSASTPQTGYWNWDPDEDPSITPVANPGAPDGAYDLYDVAMPLVRQANRLGLAAVTGKNCCPPNVRGKKFLPHWKCRFFLHRETSGSIVAQFSMKFGRRSTTNPNDLL